VGGDYKRIAVDGLWANNIVFPQSLALCPLPAVTGTATNGLGMGVATTVVLVLSGFVVASLRRPISAEVRIPVFVLIIATVVTLVHMSMNAWMHDLHKVLGLFIPLIVTNCAILGRAESFASRNQAGPAATDGLTMGLGFTLASACSGNRPHWVPYSRTACAWRSTGRSPQTRKRWSAETGTDERISAG